MSESELINGIDAIHSFIIEKKKRNMNIKEFQCPTLIADLRKSLSFKFDKDAATVFLLKEDVFAELGPPQYESVTYVVITRTPQEVRDGKITLIGPDIPESEGKSLNFGQVILCGGHDLTDLKYKELEREMFHFKNLEGFMIRALPTKLWCRVSNEVGQRGFSFETLGKALMIMYKEKYPSIKTMEVLFITTDSSQDFLELKVLGSEIRKFYTEQYSTVLKSRLTEIVETVEKQRADCDYPWSCDECDYTDVCDEVRDIVEKMKAYRKSKKPS